MLGKMIFEIFEESLATLILGLAAQQEKTLTN